MCEYMCGLSTSSGWERPVKLSFSVLLESNVAVTGSFTFRQAQ